MITLTLIFEMQIFSFSNRYNPLCSPNKPGHIVKGWASHPVWNTSQSEVSKIFASTYWGWWVFLKKDNLTLTKQCFCARYKVLLWAHFDSWYNTKKARIKHACILPFVHMCKQNVRQLWLTCWTAYCSKQYTQRISCII